MLTRRIILAVPSITPAHAARIYLPKPFLSLRKVGERANTTRGMKIGGRVQNVQMKKIIIARGL